MTKVAYVFARNATATCRPIGQHIGHGDWLLGTQRMMLTERERPVIQSVGRSVVRTIND